ncbi:MAG: cobalamin-binding protein [Candidatus Latescibacteria bacterium]|nr:cobalamin-binding protein [Candidatus Latescibacterota bacterium]
MTTQITRSDVIGLAKTEVDAHNLGISTIDEILRECGFTTIVSGSLISKAFSDPQKANHASLIQKWIREHRISVLGFSYRLNTEDAVLLFRKLMVQFEQKGLLKAAGGPLKRICFAGLPAACDRVKHLYKNEVGVFYGDETPRESLEILSIDPALAPRKLLMEHPYDRALERFGKDVIQKGDPGSIAPVDRHFSKHFGSKKEKLVDRIKHGRENHLPPIIRAHAGPYHPNRKDAVNQFVDWSKKLSESGLLDVLSIGTSQLTQEKFGEDWNGLPNGGGVPINSPEEYRWIYDASRPMLVRTYAGTINIKRLAKMHEDTLNIAWHALSLWWFSRLDGRGPNAVFDNLKEHFDTIRTIAPTGKPYEPNVPHHFAFRGSDDITYVVSAVLAARAAKILGIRDFVLQIMLNVPKTTWGVCDLAKSRAILALIRPLEDTGFRIILQTRAGLDALSHEKEKAKSQLAAITALMDDIEPHNTHSPDIIHVVSHSEGQKLATPRIIDESIRITRLALDLYRGLKTKGDVDELSGHPDVAERMQELIQGASEVLTTIENGFANPYSPHGFYEIFKAGFLPVPQLMGCREEFPEAVRWQTRMRNGRVDIYEDGKIVSPTKRMRFIKEEVLRR